MTGVMPNDERNVGCDFIKIGAHKIAMDEIMVAENDEWALALMISDEGPHSSQKSRTIRQSLHHTFRRRHLPRRGQLGGVLQRRQRHMDVWID